MSAAVLPRARHGERAYYIAHGCHCPECDGARARLMRLNESIEIFTLVRDWLGVERHESIMDRVEVLSQEYELRPRSAALNAVCVLKNTAKRQPWERLYLAARILDPAAYARIVSGGQS